MDIKPLRIFLVVCLSLALPCALADIERYPRLITKDGNMILEPGINKNVSIRLYGRSRLLVNEYDMLDLMAGNRIWTGNSSGPVFDNLKLQTLVESVNSLQNRIFGRGGLKMRVDILQNRTQTSNNNLIVSRLQRRLNNLDNRLSTLNRRLRVDNCVSNPCLNGGTCMSIYNGFQCKCVKGFEGKTCAADVNECTLYAGTDLGCQNQAQCINQYGSYSCLCSSGWQGIHCTQRKTDCMHASSAELCGHGSCVNSNDNFGYRCICEQGWKTNGLTPACNVDVDECREFMNSCTTKCINLPGGFMCSPCEAGLTGNGLVCKDIDECATDNGGCSVTPFVPCINSFGSFHCGECPIGWIGDGRVCTRNTAGSCTENICHSAALCSEISNRVVCQCPEGMVGNGIGPNGCLPRRTSTCYPNPCLNGGVCRDNGNRNYTCICPLGFRPPNCVRAFRVCDGNPCRNGGTCRPQGSDFTCSCLPGYVGKLCDQQRSRCGEYITSNEGFLKYPTGSEYNHNAQCSWVIRVDENKALNVTFTQFDIEDSMECRFDWLQIHDGATAAAQLIGRFCGTRPPLGGNIITTANRIYLWFKSDNSTAKAGFRLTWNAIDPICGGEVSFDSHATISSPGSPGLYPPNRSCEWRLLAPTHKRIRLVFFSLKLENHTDCDHDRLEIVDAVSNSRIEIFCTTSSPSPLTVPSNEILLKFHSDGVSSDLGFQIFASTAERIPGCGWTYTNRRGEISSPTNIDGPVSCEYVVRYPLGIRVQLEVTEFKMGQKDCLEIFEIGPMAANKTASGWWCGNMKVPVFSSMGNIVQINYHSSGGTFKMSYRALCHYTFEDPSGVITSPNYPSAYPSDETCVYEIIGTPHQVISLEFIDIELEAHSSNDCSLDFIVVDDGTNTTAAGPFCGTNIPPKIVSSTNWLKITLKTDMNVAGRGFKANYTLVSTGNTCGGILRKRSGEIKFPQSGQYAHDLTCTWTIFAPPNYGIQLTWISFQLEYTTDCLYDFVEIYDTEDLKSGARPLSRYCGGNLPPAIVTSTSVLTLKFTSDSSEALDGFLVKYSVLDTSTLCGGKIFSSTGMIQSPEFPFAYPNNVDCQWTISVQPGNQMELIVKSMDLEQSNNCTNDWLEIRNGATNSSPIINKFCGQNIPKRFQSFTHEIYVHFKSNAQIRKKGFQIEWQSIASGCGGVIKADHGSVVSPFYPQHYNNDAQCEWVISVNQGSTILMTFEDVAMESFPSCDFDSIEIYDGLSTDKARLARLCEMTSTTYETTGSSALIRFQTDASSTDRGFLLKYVSNCNRHFNATQGTIESPNFGDNNPSDVNCTWTIHAPKGNRIVLEFDVVGRKDFGELKDGVVYVKEGKNNTTTKVINAKRYEFQAEWVEVSLNSSSTFFRVEYAVRGCVGSFHKDTGGFTSPQYPQLYPNDIGCLWYIETEFGKAIEVVFSDVDIEQSDNCTKDSIQIWNKAEKRHSIGKLCGKQENATFTSSGNTMYVEFSSDGQGTRKGFNASYRIIPAKCGGVITSSRNTIYSPNYPNEYDPNLHCEWLIQVPEHSTMNITLEELDLEQSYKCFSDSLTITDGAPSTNEGSPESKTFCGQQLPEDNVFMTTSNKANVVFESDVDIQYKGFKFSYKENCGKRIDVNETGRIRFQGSDDTACSWTFIASDRSTHVTFTTTHSALRPLLILPEDECKGVMIFDGDFKNTTNVRPRTHFCSHHPPPYTSFGHALTITLDPAIISEFEGFYSLMDNTCGGEFSSMRGTFASPAYPISYPVNVECVWRIVASPGNALTLTIQSLDLEVSDDCNKDYLEVRSDNSEGALLAVYCGSAVPTPITAARSLWIKFKSDNDYVGKGFIASYSYAIETTINGTEGVIESPRFPNQFLSQTGHSWRIIVSRGQRILIAFSHFDSSYENSMKIYDGYDEEAELVEMPEDKLIRSSSSFMYLRAAKGIFRLAWYQVSVEFIAENKTVQTDRWNCSNTMLEINSRSLEFKSPGYPTGYDSNINCSWILSPVDYGSHAVVSFAAIDLENDDTCSMDRVVVSSSYDLANWKELTRKCKLERSQTFQIIGDRFLKVEFLTDFGVNGTGFLATANSRCGSVLTEPRGAINTSTYNSIAVFRLECTWKIRVKTGRRVKLTFENSNLFGRNDTTGACISYLLLKNGFSEHSPNLGRGRYCDDNFDAIPITSSNEAYVKVNFERQANQLPWVSFRYEEVMNACENVIELDDAHPWVVIKSENYPNIPHAHSTCVWRIKAPSTRSIQVDFTEELQLKPADDCGLEYVELLDGSTNLAPLIGRFCGQTRPNSQHSSGNFLRIIHFTDIAEPSGGFIANVSLSFCGGTYRQLQGSFSSPKIPSLVPLTQGFSCDYLISLHDSNDVELNIDSLRLPPATNCSTVNHLSITLMYEDEASNTVLKRCGNSNNQSFMLEASNILVKLVIVDPSSKSNSFQITYSGIGHRCGETIEEESGVLKSPGFLRMLARPIRCVWKIKVPKGRKVKLEFLDFNLPERNQINGTQRDTFTMPDGLIVGNDWDMKSVIGRYNQSPGTPIFSSDNLMIVYSFEAPTPRKMGFRARFSSDEETQLCNVNFQTFQGSVHFQPPGNDSVFCSYNLDVGSNETISLSLGTVDVNLPQRFLCARYSPITITSKPQNLNLPLLCPESRNETTIRLPFSGVLSLLKSRHNSLKSLDLKFNRHSCGGVFTIGNQFNLTAPTTLQANYGAMNCAWQVLPNPGDLPQFEITVSVDFKLNCDEQYLIVYTDSTMVSPRNGRFCKQATATNLVSINGVFIEYHTSNFELASTFNLSAVVGAGCGGQLSYPYRDIDFRKQYQNNVECVWTITAGIGYHIELSFGGRFFIESSANCTKDYILVQEQAKTDDWIDLGRICGRNTPSPIKSTNNLMRMTFRSDDNALGDGFTAKFTRKCGGELRAGTGMQQLSSPNYPLEYDHNLNCTYKILPGESEVATLVQIREFSLEDSVTGNCEFDNLTVYIGSEIKAVLCGNKHRQEFRSSEPITLVFSTDSTFKSKGFLLEYGTEQCGGTITSTTSIETPKQKADNKYPHNAVCTWNITAPERHKIVVKFEKLEFEGAYSCSFDHVDLYTGLEVSKDQMVGRLCGNLTGKIPPLTINSSLGIIQSVSDQSEYSIGFSAIVKFVKMCDKTIELKNAHDTFDLNDFANGYENNLSCGFLFKTSPGNILQVEFHNFHVDDTGNCQTDYLQILEGGGLFGDEIGRFCGHQLPPVISSSRSTMFLRFITDSSVTSSGFSATVKVFPTMCGATDLSVNKSSVTTIKLNTYNQKYQSNMNCIWRLRSSGQMQIDFLSLDVQGPNANGTCDTDYVKVYKKMDIWSDEPSNVIFNGDSIKPFVDLDGEKYEHYVFCGRTLPGGFFVNGKDAYVRFFSDSSIEGAGFELKATEVGGCRRNYTATQGRVYIAATTDCEIYITAPANYSIASYFNSGSFFASSNCSQFYTELNDMNDVSAGQNGRRIRKICGHSLEPVNSVFSRTNKLRIFMAGGDVFKSFDMTFLASDRGPGCGGDLFNTFGVFTSPFFPEEVRNNSDCRWNIRVPHLYAVQLDFLVFDLGSKATCQSDFLEIIENDNPEVVARKYCGGDEPKMYVSSRNTVSVRFRRTLNFAGMGWVINFNAVHNSYTLN